MNNTDQTSNPTKNIDKKLVDIMREVTYDGGYTPDGIDEAKEAIKSLLREVELEARKDEQTYFYKNNPSIVALRNNIKLTSDMSNDKFYLDRITELDNLLGSK